MPDNDFDKLVGQDVRERKASRMVPTQGPLPINKQHEIREALQDFMKQHDLTQADVARGIRSTATYVSNLLTSAGSLPAMKRSEMLRDINSWMEREARAREARRPDDFVQTKVAERMYAVAERLGERPDMALMYGPAGIGKTKTIEAIAAEIPTVIAITADHDSRFPRGLLRKVHNSASRQKLSRPVRLEEVVEKLRIPSRIAIHNVLIVDQAHELHDRSIKVLAELMDAARCSILLVGTVDLKKRIASDDDDQFGQLSSRFGMRINLAPELIGLFSGGRKAATLFSVDDIRKIFRQGKLKLHPDAAKMLCDVANHYRGTLRRVARLFDWAEVAARKSRSDQIKVEHVRAAVGIVEEDMELVHVESSGRAVEATA